MWGGVVRQRLAKAELRSEREEGLQTSGSGGECVQTTGSGGVGLQNSNTNCGAALKLLSVAASLKTEASKWVRVAVQVGENPENPESSSSKVGITLLAVSLILAAVGALILIAWSRDMRSEGPRVQSARAESEKTDSEWSVLSEQEGEPSEGSTDVTGGLMTRVPEELLGVVPGLWPSRPLMTL